MVPRPAPAWRPVRMPIGPIAAIAALTLLVSTAGLLVWPVPTLSDGSVWMVTDVPGVLWQLLVGVSALCITAAVALTRRTVDLDTRDPTTLAWLGLLVLSAGALVWNALYAAALSATAFGAIIPIFHWLFSFLPAVLAGALFTRRGREARWAAALGTGVVTVPLFHLFAVLLLPGSGPATLLMALMLTFPLAVLPLVGAVAIAGTLGDRDQGDPQPYPFAH